MNNISDFKQQSEDRIIRLLHYLTDYIYTVTIKDNKVEKTYHGPGCFPITGYKSEDYQKDPELWYRMVHKKDRNKVLKQAKSALAGKDVSPIEHRIIHRNGTIRWVKNSIVLTKGTNGELIEYNGLINDITERKKAEDIAEIKQQNLMQAEKMASLGTLVSGVAHEINNPNNFIMLNTRLLSRVWKDVSPILREYFDVNGDFVLAGMSYAETIDKINHSIDGILEGTKRIEKIIKGLTNYSRHDTGEMSQYVNVNRIIELAIVILGNTIKNSTKHFYKILSGNLSKVKGNSQQLEQVLINLINNACQSLVSREESITITTTENPKNVIIKIEDKGIGIEEQYINHIMDPFFTTKRDSGGTGLGLSISYNIIERHGGKLIIESEKDKGTAATIFLPKKTEEISNYA